MLLLKIGKGNDGEQIHMIVGHFGCKLNDNIL